MITIGSRFPRLDIKLLNSTESLSFLLLWAQDGGPFEWILLHLIHFSFAVFNQITDEALPTLSDYLFMLLSEFLDHSILTTTGHVRFLAWCAFKFV